MDDHAYFRAIEEHFIRLRGAPLLLSPADWQEARLWHREGIPLELVRSALDEVFERRAERGGNRPIQSLRYCTSAVRAAWERSSKMAQAGRRQAAPPLDLEARLEALAAAIPGSLPGVAELRASVTALARSEGGAEQVESALAGLDRQLLEAAVESVGEERLAEIERASVSGLSALGDRLSADESRLAGLRLREQALRRELRLPVLSLFSEP